MIKYTCYSILCNFDGNSSLRLVTKSDTIFALMVSLIMSSLFLVGSNIEYAHGRK